MHPQKNQFSNDVLMLYEVMLILNIMYFMLISWLHSQMSIPFKSMNIMHNQYQKDYDTLPH